MCAHRVVLCRVAGCGAGQGPVPAADGLLVCPGCHRGLTRDLRALPALYQACEQALTGARRTREKVSGRPSYGITLNAAAVEARNAVRGLLASWSDLVVEERRCTAPSRSVDATAPFLTRHADWLCAHPAGADAVQEFAEVTRRARAAAYPHWTRKLRVGPCVEPDCPGSLLALLRSDDQLMPSEVVCDTDERHAWPATTWRELNRKVGPHRGTRWLSVRDVAHIWGLSASNVYRLASENEWRRRVVGRRVFYLESDVRSSIDREPVTRR